MSKVDYQNKVLPKNKLGNMKKEWYVSGPGPCFLIIPLIWNLIMH